MQIDEKIAKELSLARNAREKGNEGMARVCARRAAGIAVRDFLYNNGIEAPTLNNFEILLDKETRSTLPIEVMTLLEHLTLRVDENYNLPANIDLIRDAEEVIQLLIRESTKKNGR